MYNATKLKEGLIDLVGWRGTDTINTSESGLYYDGEHPLLTIENLKAIAPTEATFETWLKTQTEDGIIKAIQRLLNEKLSQGTARGILDTRTLFPIPAQHEELPDDGVMYGYALTPYPAFGVGMRIQRIGLAFTNPCSVVVKLWHTTQKDPVHTQTISYTKNGSIEWVTADSEFTFVYSADDVHIGGAWFLTYEPVLGSKPIKMTDTHTIYRNYLHVFPFQVEPQGEMWDWSENRAAPVGGLNIQVSLQTDFTAFLVDQRHHLQDLISKQVAMTLLRQMAFNPQQRINQPTANARRTEILYELDGDSTSMKKSGLKYEHELALKGIALDLAKLDNVIFRKKHHRLRYGTV